MERFSEMILLVLALLLVKYILPYRIWIRYLAIMFVILYGPILFGALLLTPQVDSFFFKVWSTILSGWSYYASYFVFVVSLVYSINMFNRGKA